MNILIIGSGIKIQFITRTLLSKGHKVTIINNDKRECIKLSKISKATVIFGLGTMPDILEDSGIRTMDKVLAITDKDEDNFVICQIATKIYGVPSTFAVVNDPENEKLFHEAGITTTFSVSATISDLIEKRTIIEEIINYQLIADDRLTLSEVILGDRSKSFNTPIKNLKLPDQTLIISIFRKNELFIPNGNTILMLGDRVIFLSKPDQYAASIKIFLGEEK